MVSFSHSSSAHYPSSLARKRTFAIALLAIAMASYAYTAFVGHAEKQDLAGILTAVAQSQGGNFDMFLKLDGIPGTSADQKHRNEIEIDSFSWGETRSVSATRPAMDGLSITMPTNAVSPRLFLYTAGGLKISRAILSVRRSGSQTDFLRWTLTDAQIVNFQTVGNTHGDGLNDRIVLSPAKIEVEYIPPSGSPVKAGWDQRTGKSVSY